MPTVTVPHKRVALVSVGSKSFLALDNAAVVTSSFTQSIFGEELLRH
jgi:hypothetical protein